MDRVEGGGLARRNGCPVCGADNGHTLLDLPYDADPLSRYLERFYQGRLVAESLTGRRFVIMGCDSCGLLYQRDVPDPTLLDHLYGSAARADPVTTSLKRGLAIRIAYLHQIECAVRLVNERPAAVEVLDFGAGTGLWLDAARGIGCRTTGAELRADLLDDIRERGHSAAVLDDLPDSHFHLINTEQVVEHLVDPRGVVGQLARRLRVGGVLRIAVPDGTGMATRLGTIDWDGPKDGPNSPNPIAPLEHLNCFDGPSLTRLGEEVGLTPFRYPLRVTLHRQMRFSFGLGDLLNRLHRPRTVQLFRRTR